MRLKRFMIVNFILSIILIISLYLISQLTKYYIQGDLLKLKNYLTLEKKSVKLVNLGTSHGMYGLLYSNIDFSKINLARSVQSFYYDLELLKKYQDKLNKNAVIIIPISIFSFYSHDRDNINQYYVHLLKKEEILGVNTLKYYLSSNFSIIYPPSNIINIIKNKLAKIEKNIIYPRNLEKEKIETESIETVEIHLGISEKAYLIKNAEQDFINLIRYIEEKNWKYVLITTPFSYLYNENIEKYQPGAFKDRIYDNIKEVEKKLNKKFVYLDYSHDERFENHLEYFFDDDHLNEKGAKYFTEILLEDLKKLGYEFE